MSTGRIIGQTGVLAPRKVTLAVAALTFEITGLDLAAAGSYEIHYSLKNASTIANYMRLNQDYTATNYTSSWLRSNAVGGTTGGYNNDAYVGSTDGATDTMSGIIDLNTDCDGYAVWYMRGIQGAGANKCSFFSNGRYPTLANIVTLGFKTSVNISAGSYIKAIPKG